MVVGIEGEGEGGDKGGEWGDIRKRTFCFLEDAVDGAGTAAAGHCYGEVVVVGWGGHFVGVCGVGGRGCVGRFVRLADEIGGIGGIVGGGSRR